MDIEPMFAAKVINARDEAARCTSAGFPQTEADVIEMEQQYLWACREALELQGKKPSEIERRYLRFDKNGKPRARRFSRDKVVIFKPK